MIRVEDEVHTGHILVIITLADHMSEVAAHVEVRLSSNLIVVAILLVVDVCADRTKLGHHVVTIFVHVFPAGHLVELAFTVVLSEHRIALHGENGGGEHGHGMCILWQSVEHVKYILRNLRTILPVFNNFQGLLHGWNVASQKHVPETFNVRIFTAGNFWQSIKGFRNGQATEANTFEGVEIRDIGNQALDAAGATDSLSDGNITQFDIAALLDQLGDPGAMCINFLTQNFFQCRHNSLSFGK